MHDLLTDLRLALRGLRRAPGFAAVAILTLALGIGANTALFGIVDAVLVRALPFPEPERLVSVWSGLTHSAAELDALREGMRTLSGLGAYESGARFTLTGAGEPARLEGVRVSANLFSLLGVRPILGRVPAPGEDRVGAEEVAVLGYGLWQRRFGGDPAVVGRRIVLDDEPRTIVGVMPPSFAFPSADAELWVPLAVDPAKVGWYWGNVSFRLVGRLRAGADAAAAQVELRGVAERVRRANPLWTPQRRYAAEARVVPLRDALVGEARPLLLVLLGAAAAVLLIACANVANLLLVRAAGRAREMALRRALGAGWVPLLRQLLAESVLVALAGGAAGLVVARWGTSLLVAFLPGRLPGLDAIGTDERVLAFALAVALGTGLLLGLVPALRLRADAPLASLRQGAAGSGVARGQRRLASALVAVEMAAAVVLVAAAGLLLRSFWTLRQLDPGFRVEHVLSARLDPAEPRDQPEPERQVAFYDALLARVAALPGVESAAATTAAPLSEGARAQMAFRVRGQIEDPHAQAFPTAYYQAMTPGFLRTLGQTLVRGRDITPADRDGSPEVVLVSESLAARFWPGEDPIGKQIGYPYPSPWLTVVGVVKDARQQALDQADAMAIYQPFAQAPRADMTLLLRTAGDPRALTAALRSAVAEVDPNVPVSDVRTLEQRVRDSVARPRVTAELVLAFALLALALGAVGIYGVIAYAVTQRTRELGIRSALGAGRRDLLRLVVGEGARLAAVGAGAGLLAALGVARLLRGFLFGVSPADPLTFAAVPVLLAAVALLASYLPARRAARVDPMEAMREE